jgi:hypothetical protein
MIKTSDLIFADAKIWKTMEVFHHLKRPEILPLKVANQTFEITVIAIERLFINGTFTIAFLRWFTSRLTLSLCI